MTNDIELYGNNLIVLEDKLDGFRGEACLVLNQDSGEYFVVSTITRAEFAHAYGDIETLAFRSDSDGKVNDWEDVAGGGDMTRAQVLAVLASGELNDWESEDDSYFSHDPDYLFDHDSEYLIDVQVFASDDDWEDWVRSDPSLDANEA